MSAFSQFFCLLLFRSFVFVLKHTKRVAQLGWHLAFSVTKRIPQVSLHRQLVTFQLTKLLWDHHWNGIFTGRAPLPLPNEPVLPQHFCITCVVSKEKHLQHAQNSTSEIQQNVSNAPPNSALATKVHHCLHMHQTRQNTLHTIHVSSTDYVPQAIHDMCKTIYKTHHW